MTEPRTTLERALAGVEMRPFTLGSFHRRRQRIRRNQRIAAGAVGGAVAILVGVVAVGILADARPRNAGTDPSPPSTAEPTIRFASPLYGYAISHPEGWTAVDAREPWTDGPVNAELSDVLVDERTDAVLFEGASIRIPDGMTPEEWIARERRRAGRVAGIGGIDLDGVIPTIVDGVPGVLAVPCRVVLVVTQGRGYVFRLGGDIAINLDLRAVVESIELHPERAA